MEREAVEKLRAQREAEKEKEVDKKIAELEQATAPLQGAKCDPFVLQCDKIWEICCRARGCT